MIGRKCFITNKLEVYMKNTEWYYRKSISKVGEYKLTRKVSRDIYVFIVCITLAVIGLLIMLASVFSSLRYGRTVNEMNHLIGSAMAILSTIIITKNDNIDPLSKLSMNDKLFCWIHYLNKRIILYKSCSSYKFYEKIKIKFIIKIINRDLNTISNNLDNSFVFIKDKERTVHGVNKLIEGLENFIPESRNVIEKTSGILIKIEELYMLLLSNKLLFTESDDNLKGTSEKCKDIFIKKYDDVFVLMDSFTNDPNESTSPSVLKKSLNFLKGVTRQFNSASETHFIPA